MSNGIGKSFAGVDSMVEAYTASGVEVGQVVMISYGTTEDLEVVASAVATTAFPVRVAVAAETIAAGSKGWFYIGGRCQALVDGTTAIAVDDYLKVENGGTSFVKDSTSRTAYSAAKAAEAYTGSTAALKWVVLIPEQHLI